MAHDVQTVREMQRASRSSRRTTSGTAPQRR